MTDSSLSADSPTPVSPPHTGPSLWTPGLQLMRRLPLHGTLPLLWLSLWLPALLAVAWVGVLHGLFDGAAMADWRGRPALALLCLGLLVSLYLMVCAGKALSGRLVRLRRAARLQRRRAARSARELADARAAMQLHHEQIRAAIDEAARRVVALCGLLDADRQDAERADADLEAIQDEERGALQLMAALRSRLLALAHHCRALGDAARSAGATGAVEVASLDELSGVVSAELLQCHQLSERVGGAERLNERRIESMRRSTDRLQYRAERGMGEAQQLMVLTRQVQAAQGAALQRLQQVAALCAALGAPAAAAAPNAAAEAPDAAATPRRRDTPAAAAAPPAAPAQA